MRITFLYSRLSACWMSGKCRIKGVTPQRESVLKSLGGNVISVKKSSIT
ncbi:hypothetical protein PUW24_14350 [Paenibacillus urinalis]|uniref:Uncharacterized protein n=1 Tax=Paenibacillus urinalis TaxID=521520 RepID=A0AAX3N270_9BACL|nr:MULTISPECIES: hypothetical protein [Paenibacillus]WDH83946.1 hypothetical protein PUW23_06950 [Paenibacillus urinalis]WDH95401.1 hypothetical protein PUW24_14350 [Paenibacillus urinalis]WDI03598.1 hypothetical protein PUW25_06475 [Paenibacillus urinalis]